jgi:hypothetical protein
MFKHRQLLLVILSAGLGTCFGGDSPDLPPGPAQAKVVKACTECHDSRIIVQQRLAKAAWVKEVDKMIKWGALVEAADKESLSEYLSVNFSPDKPAYVADRAQPSKPNH